MQTEAYMQGFQDADLEYKYSNPFLENTQEWKDYDLGFLDALEFCEYFN